MNALQKKALSRMVVVVGKEFAALLQHVVGIEVD